jgi:cell division septation protein DedD
MADSSSYRSSRGATAPRRDEPSADPAREAVGDPLAELARLIGQDEAFGAIVRNSSRPEPRPPEQQRQAESPPWRPRPPQADWARDAAAAPAPRNATTAALDRHFRASPPLDPELHEQDAPGHDAPAYDASAHDDRGYEAAPEVHAAARPGDPAHHDQHAGEYYDEGEDSYYEGEDEYADAAPERRRGGLVIAASVVGLALLGTAGAFGYWAWSGGSSANGEPPLIKADTTPNKVVPATQGGEGAGNKRSYDRFGGDKGSGAPERMVQREETPAEIKPPRQVFPSAGGVYGPAPSTPAAPAAAAAAPAGTPANGEPRKVHTEVIRPNQMANLDAGQVAAPPAAPPAAAAPAPMAAPAAPAPTAAPAKRAKQPAPMALGAQSPPAEPAEAPARSAAPAGGFVVQLSSQKTEEEARASFQTLQTKYAAVFGDRQPIIKRADLGAKGVVYRAQVGPFASQDQANQFCSNLKVAGGHCFVQKN